MIKSYLHVLLAVLLILGGAACSSSEDGNGGGGASSVQIPDKAGMTVKGIVRDDEIVNCDGTPRGYVVVDVGGEQLFFWYYESVGEPRQMQMRLYASGRTDESSVSW